MPINGTNLNTKGVAKNTYDVIVIGSGISGGWTAKELGDKGLKTLILARCRSVEHNKDYPTATKDLWEFPHRSGTTSPATRARLFCTWHSRPGPLTTPQKK